MQLLLCVILKNITMHKHLNIFQIIHNHLPATFLSRLCLSIESLLLEWGEKLMGFVTVASPFKTRSGRIDVLLSIAGGLPPYKNLGVLSPLSTDRAE